MIIFSSVTKIFADNTAISDLSLEIADGELVLITGPSGAGKTTLMKLLIKEYTPNSGEITIDDMQLSKLKNSQIAKLRQQIGVVFQDYKLIPDMNSWENIALPLYIAGKSEDEIESRVTDLLNLVDLADKALYFPNQLSGGEAQRIGIARALATGPRVIFADEPTGNLDDKTALHITRLLKKINQLGTTLLIATHNETIIKELDAHKIVRLGKGSVPEKVDQKKNPPSEVKADEKKGEEEKLEKTETKKDEHSENQDEKDEERAAVKAKQEKLEKQMIDEDKKAQKKEPSKKNLPWQKLKLAFNKKPKSEKLATPTSKKETSKESKDENA